jgi:hypothetical protein
MFELIKKYKREFVYSSYLFLIFEMLVTPSLSVNISFYLLISLVGYALVNLWLITTYKLNAGKKVSQYSDVLIRVNLWERLFSYVFLPLLFYTSVVSFLLFSPSRIINQLVIVVSISLFFYLFLFVRTSYERMYSVNRKTRVATDFISIVVFFIATTVLNRVIRTDAYLFVAVFFLSVFSLIYILYHHNKFDIHSAILAFLSSLAISSVVLWVNLQGIYAIPSLLSILYYLVISLWNVRFTGSRSFSDYIPPLMFSVMAIILVLSL